MDDQGGELDLRELGAEVRVHEDNKQRMRDIMDALSPDPVSEVSVACVCEAGGVTARLARALPWAWLRR